ncbi:MAG: hypothetical protein WC526_01460 [Patescibacteria group bacterium]
MRISWLKNLIPAFLLVGVLGFLFFLINGAVAAPVAPRSPTSTVVSAQSISLTWSTTTADSGQYWVLRRATSSVGVGGITHVATSSTSTVSYTFTGLATNTLYFLAVASGDTTAATSSYATSSAVYTWAATPGTPTVTSSAATSLTITINPTSNPTTASTTYVVHDAVAHKFLQADSSWGTATTTLTYTQLGGASGTTTAATANAHYTISVAAVNGDSSATTSYSTAASTYVVVSTPSSAAVTAAANGFTFSWTGDSGSEFYAEDETGATNSGWTTDTSYVVSGVNCGTAHTFRVKARNSDTTESGWSSEVSATTNACGGGVVTGGGGGSGSSSNIAIPNVPVSNLAAAQAAATAAGCPALSAGDMVKVTGKAAIYSINSNLQVLYFPSGDEFKSWNVDNSYGGYKSVSQTCFDALSVPSSYPGAVNYRPGSYIVKRPSSDQLYVVEPGNALATISVADAKALYGDSYKVMTVADPFWPHYINRGSAISGAAHQGMLISKDTKTWYVDAGNVLREVTANGMTANRFKTNFVHTVADSYLTGFTTGSLINDVLSSLSDRTQ